MDPIIKSSLFLFIACQFVTYCRYKDPHNNQNKQTVKFKCVREKGARFLGETVKILGFCKRIHVLISLFVILSFETIYN